MISHPFCGSSFAESNLATLSKPHTRAYLETLLHLWSDVTPLCNLVHNTYLINTLIALHLAVIECRCSFLLQEYLLASACLYCQAFLQG